MKRILLSTIPGPRDLADGIDLDEFMDWQVKNITAACDNLVRRKQPDMDALEAEWNRLEPLRANMKDMPPDPGRTPP